MITGCLAIVRSDSSSDSRLTLLTNLNFEAIYNNFLSYKFE